MEIMIHFELVFISVVFLPSFFIFFSSSGDKLGYGAFIAALCV